MIVLLINTFSDVERGPNMLIVLIMNTFSEV